MAPPRRARTQPKRSKTSGRGRPDGRRLAIIIVAIVIIVVLVVALMAAAFGGRSSSGPQKSLGTFNPQVQFAIGCGSCHRPGGPGPHLTGALLTKTFPNIEDQITFVSNGKDGMPPQKDAYTPDELRQIVEYTRTLP